MSPTSASRPLTVTLAVSPLLWLNCLRQIFHAQGFEVLSTQATSESAVSAAVSLRPTIAVVGLRLPPSGGLHVITSIRHARADQRIVALIDSSTTGDVECALRSGALSCVFTDQSWDACRNVLRAAASGDAILPQGFQRDRAQLGRLLPQPSSTERSRQERRYGRTEPECSELSRREHQVLSMVGRGCGVERIARDLTISPKTVKHHLSAVYAKLGVHNRTDAVLAALDRRIIHLDGVESRGADQASGCSGASGEGASPFSP